MAQLALAPTETPRTPFPWSWSAASTTAGRSNRRPQLERRDRYEPRNELPDVTTSSSTLQFKPVTGERSRRPARAASLWPLRVHAAGPTATTAFDRSAVCCRSSVWTKSKNRWPSRSSGSQQPRPVHHFTGHNVARRPNSSSSGHPPRKRSVSSMDPLHGLDARTR